MVKKTVKGGYHAAASKPHSCASARCAAGDGGFDRLRPGGGADELAAQSLSFGRELGQAAGRPDLGLDVRRRYRSRWLERVGRRALWRVRAAWADGAALGARQALRLSGLAA